jgi:hypothetical protein
MMFLDFIENDDDKVKLLMSSVMIYSEYRKSKIIKLLSE